MKRWEKALEDKKIIKKRKLMSSKLGGLPVKQRILHSAVSLFAQKGLTETTIHEIMGSIGMSDSNLYTYFASKSSILDNLLSDYSTHFIQPGFLEGRLSVLDKNPTTDGVMSCLRLSFPKGLEEYYLNILYVILLEQYRNPIVNKFMAEKMILRHEETIRTIINKLIEINILRPDTDTAFFSKIHSSLIYTFSSRRLLGLGDGTFDFINKSMMDWLRALFDMMFKIYGVENDKNTEDKDMIDLMRNLHGLMNRRNIYHAN